MDPMQAFIARLFRPHYVTLGPDHYFRLSDRGGVGDDLFDGVPLGAPAPPRSCPLHVPALPAPRRLRPVGRRGAAARVGADWIVWQGCGWTRTRTRAAALAAARTVCPGHQPRWVVLRGAGAADQRGLYSGWRARTGWRKVPSPT